MNRYFAIASSSLALFLAFSCTQKNQSWLEKVPSPPAQNQDVQPPNEVNGQNQPAAEPKPEGDNADKSEKGDDADKVEKGDSVDNSEKEPGEGGSNDLSKGKGVIQTPGGVLKALLNDKDSSFWLIVN